MLQALRAKIFLHFIDGFYVVLFKKVFTRDSTTELVQDWDGRRSDSSGRRRLLDIGLIGVQVTPNVLERSSGVVFKRIIQGLRYKISGNGEKSRLFERIYLESLLLCIGIQSYKFWSFHQLGDLTTVKVLASLGQTRVIDCIFFVQDLVVGFQRTA